MCGVLRKEVWRIMGYEEWNFWTNFNIGVYSKRFIF